MSNNTDHSKETVIDWLYCILFAALLVMVLMVFLAAFTLTSGCVSIAKNAIIPTPEPTPAPTTPPTGIPTTAPTPIPGPVYDWTTCGWQDQCYQLRSWHHFWRENVTGYMDLSAHATVYAYKILPKYHYFEPLWGSRSYFLESPQPGNVFLFVFVNVYTDGDDVRTHGWGPTRWNVAIRDQLFYPIDTVYPKNRIQELDNSWDYAHVQSPRPYPYVWIQEAGTGIITAEYQEWIKGGRSNAHDGYLIFEVPYNFNVNETKVTGNFDNVGGQAWWQLE